MVKTLGLSLLVLMVAACPDLTHCTIEKRKELYDKLFKNHNPDLRPTKGSKETIDVQIEVFVRSLLNLDAVEQFIVLHGMIQMTWTDVNLKWNTSEYGDIGDIPVKQKKVWRPDVSLSNAVDKKQTLGFDELPVMVNPTGRVSWRPSNIFKLHCQIDVTFFPFDKQTCNMTLATFVTRRVRFRPRRFHWKTNLEHQIWKITDGRFALRNIGENPVPTVDFSLELERRPEYHVINLIIPVILLSIANVMVFLLPAESGEKASFSMTVLLAFVVFLSYAGSNLPVTSLRTSYMAVYISTLIGISCLILGSNVLILNLYHRTSQYFIPSWMAFINRKTIDSSLKVNPSVNGAPDMLDSALTIPDVQQKARYVRVQQADVAKFLDMTLFCLFSLTAVVTHTVFITIMKNGEGN